MGKKSKEKNVPQDPLAACMERDLTAAAESGQLAPAFEVDDRVAELSRLLESGKRPTLIGDQGVGKTAIVHELIRRFVKGDGPAAMRGRRIVQVSIRRQKSMIGEHDSLGAELRKLWAHKSDHALKPTLFIRDAHCAESFDIEDTFAALLYAYDGPIICEGSEDGIETLTNSSSAVEQQLALMRVTEPSPTTVERMVEQWRRHQLTQFGRRFDDIAVAHALNIAHQYLSSLRMPRAVIELLQRVAAGRSGDRVITLDDVIETVTQLHGVSPSLIDPRAAFDHRRTRAVFTEKLHGQPEAIDAVVNAIGTIKTGLHDSLRPMASFLLVGPTGVGKTYLARLLAEEFFGSADRLARVNMGDHAGDSEGSLLFGLPGAYSLAFRRGKLTRLLASHACGVLLFDELEKGHVNLRDRLLPVIDEGQFTNGAGERINCRASIIMMTTNIGSDRYGGGELGFAEYSDQEAVQRELTRQFRPEFLNRFTRVLCFSAITPETCRLIARHELKWMAARPGIRERGLRLSFDDDVVRLVAERGYDAQFGVRFLKRAIEREITPPLAAFLASHRPPPQTMLRLGLRQGEVMVEADTVPADTVTAGKLIMQR